MKLLIIVNGGTVPNAIKTSTVFSSIVTINYTTGINYTSYGSSDELLIYFYYVDYSSDSGSSILSLLNQGYTILHNMCNGISSSTDILFNLGFFKQSGNFNSSIDDNINTIPNDLSVNINGTTKSQSLKINSVSRYVTTYTTNSAVNGYINLGTSSVVSPTTDTVYGVFPSGTVINGKAITGCLVFCGGFTFSEPPSNNPNDLQNMLKDISSMVTSKGRSKKYYISGKITDSNNSALVRKVRAYDKATGSMLSETMSNSDGTYSLVMYINTPTYVVCIHDSSDSNNSQILDDIIPYSN